MREIRCTITIPLAAGLCIELDLEGNSALVHSAKNRQTYFVVESQMKTGLLVVQFHNSMRKALAPEIGYFDAPNRPTVSARLVANLVTSVVQDTHFSEIETP
jgi:hypothetical protein